MRPRKILRIGRWEVTKNAGGIDRKTAAVVGATLLVLGAAVPLVLAQGGVTLDEGFYRVGVAEESPLYPVVEDDPTFAVRDSDAELGSAIDLQIDGTQVVASDTQKGQAALAELRGSVDSYNDRVMAGESNQSAAFPVTVTLEYAERNRTIAPADGGDGTTGDGATGGGAGDQGGSDDGGGDGTTGDGGDGSDGGTTGGTTDGGAGGDGATGGGSSGDIGSIARGLTGSDAMTGTPSDISPPFPFQSLILAFLFVIPLNFVIQAYGSTMLSERLNRRGELMLVAPVSRWDIIAGKTLPYFLGAMVFEGAIAGAIIALEPGSGSGAYALLAVVPLVLLFLAATFLGAMFARSFKELTFVTVSITVGLTTYAFVPAIFTDVTPIALVSPLTIVVRDIQGVAIEPLEMAISTVPPLFTATLFFVLGAGLYREEDMFTQRSIPLKVLDSLAGRIRRRRSVALVVVLLMPLVILAELVAVAAVYPISMALPRELWLGLILLAIVVIEEVAKSLPAYAGFVHNRYDRTVRSALTVGALAGLGFFVAEKGLLIVQLLGGLPEVQQAAVVSAGPTAGISPMVALVLLLAPLALHVVTAATSAVGMRSGRQGYAVGLTAAIAIHFVYNFAVVMLVV
ncbi:ABC transporter permease family protein [Halapricum hydrolyticum]|uniref:ABC transporter permease subunit n=1 Tax=Halapricum hydrolyticum TaxID=2979991 RepID=A0AAE3IB48_9EURY|nr:ABC transporter permease subunit [Halapricum hydrolyticum]MCU4717385.1 ABC transporter permease subunit [Halapricum hydrolyticum]MCU4726549.1 ABC transporter permease subunit [Halapricum hydrolyticum]